MVLHRKPHWHLLFSFITLLLLSSCSIASPQAPSSIFVFDTAQGKIINQFSGGEESYWGPRISPDGSTLAFSIFVEGADVVELYLMDIDGSNLRPLTSNERDNYLPSWSPDGSRLTYVSQEAGETSTAEIYAISLDGSNDVPLTSNEAFEYGSSWSPDGQFIVFGTAEGGQWHIAMMEPDGSKQTLVEVAAHGNAPALSPDGERIAFTSDREGNDDIWIMNADGSDQMNLTPNEFWDDQPAWSPDGKMIAFTSDREGAPAIYLMNADGSGVRPLIDIEFSDMAFPSWHPNGEWIIFHGVQAD